MVKQERAEGKCSGQKEGAQALGVFCAMKETRGTTIWHARGAERREGSASGTREHVSAYGELRPRRGPTTTGWGTGPGRGPATTAPRAPTRF